MRSCSSVVMANKYSWRIPWAWKTHQRLVRSVSSPTFTNAARRETQTSSQDGRKKFLKLSTLRGYIRGEFGYK